MHFNARQQFICVCVQMLQPLIVFISDSMNPFGLFYFNLLNIILLYLCIFIFAYFFLLYYTAICCKYLHFHQVDEPKHYNANANEAKLLIDDDGGT